jgi:hypothetical protein
LDEKGVNQTKENNNQIFTFGIYEPIISKIKSKILRRIMLMGELT